MNYIVSPNLPEKNVSLVLLGQDAAGFHGGEIIRNLEDASIRCLIVPRIRELSRPVASHPDMLCHHLGGNRLVVCRELADKMAPELKRFGFSVTRSSRVLGPRYPDDVALNAAVIGKTAFFRSSSVDKTLLDSYTRQDMKIIEVKQGYAKCSIFPVDSNSLITSDPFIAKRAAENGFDVLVIREGHICLPGYDYGFIGGCGGLLSRKTACFAGNIETHPDYNRIRGFLTARGMKYISLCSGPLNDIGGILPLMEAE